MSRYRFVSTVKAEGFPVDAACEVAEVSASAYYEWAAKTAAGPTEAEWNEALVINEMHKVHDDLDDSYGSPRMTTELASRGLCTNHKRVERLMAANGIYARDGRRKKVRTTIPDVSAPPLPDLVGRRFAPGEPGERTCGDITYVPTGEGWLYLADVLDLGSRRVVGYAMDERMPTELVARALEMAVELRGGDVEGMIFHHDRGAQGEFNWSSQHLEVGGADGQASWVDEGVDGPLADEVAGGSVPSAGSRAAVLASDRDRGHHRRGLERRRCLTCSGCSLVPASWRHANRSVAHHRPLSLLSRTRRDRDLESTGRRDQGDRPATGTSSFDDLAGTAPQRCHSRRPARISSIGSAMEGRAGGPTSEDSEAPRQRVAATLRAGTAGRSGPSSGRDSCSGSCDYTLEGQR